MPKRYELTFYGAATVRAYRIPRHRRYHATLESAQEEAAKVHETMDERQLPTAAHPAVIYGPDGREYGA